MFTRYREKKERFLTRTDCDIDCLYCNNSVIYMPQINARNRYGNMNYHLECKPAEEKQQKYLNKYFIEHKIKKTIGYIALIVPCNDAYLYRVKRKTKPIWCPKKKKEAQEQK